MSTPAKPEDVCVGCRSRKKKCDGTRPSCASCLKRGELCLYSALTAGRPSAVSQNTWLAGIDLNNAPQPQTWDRTTLPTQAQTWIDPSQWANLDMSFLADSSEIASLPTPQKSSSPSDTRSPPTTDTLPDTPLFLDLVDIYFDRLYPYLPIIHRAKLTDAVRRNGIESLPSALVLAIAALTASHHPDQAVQARQDGWFVDAKTHMTKHMHTPDHAVQSLQAAILIIYQAVVQTDFSTTWILLGEAWRKAVAMGCSQVDGGKVNVIPALGQNLLQDWIETEEARRCTWMLYIFDRGVCFSVGLIHAIDDRRLRINFPMPDAVFQTASPYPPAPPAPSASDAPPIPFSPDMDALITSVQTQCRRRTASALQLLVLAYVLLSNISELLHSHGFDYDTHEPKLEALIAHLVRIQLMLPHRASDLSAASYKDFPVVVWLNFVLTACTIMLHHRPLKEGETVQGPSSMANHWPHCVAAARNSVSMIRQASRSSARLLINAHTPTLVFTLSRILIIEYFCPSRTQPRRKSIEEGESVQAPVEVVRDPALRGDLEVLVLTFTRLRDGLNSVGEKFYKGFAYWITQGPTVAPEGKRIGSLTLLHTCENWPAVSVDQDIEIPS